MSAITRPIVVIDTQLVLRATINPKSLPARLLFQLSSTYLLVVSPDVKAEVKDVLTRPKIRAKFPQLTDALVEQTMAVLDAAHHVVPENPVIASRDPKDDKFLALAVESNAQYLVSEDKDLLVLNPFQGIQIINALEFIQIINPPRASNTLPSTT